MDHTTGRPVWKDFSGVDGMQILCGIRRTQEASWRNLELARLRWPPLPRTLQNDVIEDASVWEEIMGGDEIC